MRADYVRVRDVLDSGTRRDDLTSLSFWQGLGPNLQVHYRHVFLEQESRDQTARVTFQEPEWDLLVQASFYELMETQEVLSIDFDSFYLAAQEYHPYLQGSFLVSKGFWTHFRLDVGGDQRKLEDRDDEGPLNREFRRGFVTPMLLDLPWKGLQLSVPLEAWDVRRRDEGDFWTAGIDLTQKCSDRFRFSVGTAYALYKYDYFAELERQKVRTYYAKGVLGLTRDLRIDVAYEYERGDYEDDDLDDAHVLRVGVRHSF